MLGIFSTSNNHWLWGEVRSESSKIGQSIVANIVINILQIFISLFVMAVYNKVIPNQAFSSLVSLTAGISIAILFDFIFKLLKSRIIHDVCKSIDARLQPKLFKKIISWDLQSRPQFSGGISSLIRDLESVIELFTNSSITTLVGIPFVFVNIFVIYLIAGPLALVTAAICTLTLASSIFYYFTVVSQAEEAKKAGIDKSSVFLEAISNLEALKSIGDYEYFEDKWKDVDSRTRTVSSKLRDSLADVGSINAMISSLGQVSIVAVGAYLVINGGISSGALIASVILNGRTVQPLTQLAALLQKFSTAKASYQRLDKVFLSVSEEEKRRQNIRLDTISGPITVENLMFQPQGLPAPIVQVPKIRITDGQKVGIVGSVGSGKSTFLKLLAGVLTPTNGTVVYGTFDTTAIHQSDLRKRLSYLGQSPGIFGGTVRENIALSNPDIPEEKLLEVIKITGLDNVLKRLPNGLSFKLSEGGRELSGGQKQILALTRAIASDPSIILFDEPTSAMDPKHEVLFIRQMQQFIKNKTFIVITHRKPILALTDRLIVIESGKIILDGPRDEVLSKFK